MNTAPVQDVTPARIRHIADWRNKDTAAAGIFADLSDGVVVAQHLFNFYGFTGNGSKFALLVIGLCGEGGQAVEKYDEELAEFARCSVRTIRTYRADYLAEARRLNCNPLGIVEGDYDRDRQRYERTRYCVTAEVATAIERAVTEARTLPAYPTDRLKALEQAAGLHYDDIPDAPPPARKRKPKKSQRAPVLQHLKNAGKHLARGKVALAEMPVGVRAALLAGEGENMRAALLAMQAEISALLVAIPEDIDSIGVDYIPAKVAGIPPARPDGEKTAAGQPAPPQTHFRVDQKKERGSKLPEPEVEHSPESVAVFARLEDRARGKPPVRSVEVELCPPDRGSPLTFADYTAAVQRHAAELQRARGVPKGEAEADALCEFGSFEKWRAEQAGEFT
jgi:hypothetical protein